MEAQRRGLITTSSGMYRSTSRLSPPLTVTIDEASRFLEIFEESIRASTP
ncbi:MAG: hypothetical protein ACREBS_07860 [Nitrososphaerales archaeon]